VATYAIYEVTEKGVGGTGTYTIFFNRGGQRGPDVPATTPTQPSGIALAGWAAGPTTPAVPTGIQAIGVGYANNPEGWTQTQLYTYAPTSWTEVSRRMTIAYTLTPAVYLPTVAI
jgi:hypothetical protein